MSMVEKMLKHRLRETTSDRFVIEMNMPKDYPAIEAPVTEEGGVRERFFKSVAELPDEITVVHPFNVDAFEESNKNNDDIVVNSLFAETFKNKEKVGEDFEGDR